MARAKGRDSRGRIKKGFRLTKGGSVVKASAKRKRRRSRKRRRR